MSKHSPEIETLTAEVRPQRDTLFWIGAIGTVAWLGGGIAWLLVFSKPVLLQANEWGDIFAGLAAPVAFLWLVLGFKQQGRELQLSTRALELQVAELRQSVEQQKELVGVTRDQFQANIDEQERRRLAELEAKQPKFLIHQNGTSGGPEGRTVYHFALRNEGATATNVLLKVAPVSHSDNVRFETVMRGDLMPFGLHYSKPPVPLSVAIDYDDIEGILRTVYFLGEFELGRGLLFKRTSTDTHVAQDAAGDRK